MMDNKTVIENIVIKYRFNFNEPQDPQKIFKVAMGSEAKAELLKDIKVGQELIKSITDDVNLWSEDKIKDEYNKRGLEEKKEKREKHLVFPKMENVIDGEVITCYPPEPSKFPHIGHAYACGINYLFAKAHKGKFYIRFEDTNPDLAKEEYYNEQMDGYKWLGIESDLIVNASDYMELYYQKIELLIKDGRAYVCLAKAEDISGARRAKQSPAGRDNTTAQNLALWKEMLSGKYNSGEALILAKMDVLSPRAELRDPALMRINKNPHPKTGTKYHLWPSYIFQSVVLDGEMKVTHRFRSKEFEAVKPSQIILSEWLGYKYPNIFEFARINIKGTKASGRELRELVKSGGLSWDHPALNTLVALKRRGYLKEAIWEFIDKAGVSKSESTIEWSVLDSFNRKILSQRDIAKIPSFNNPIKVKVVDKLGLLENKVDDCYIDSNVKEGIEFRVRHLSNVILNNGVLEVTSLDPKKGLSMLPIAKEVSKLSVLMPEFENNVKTLYVSAQEYKGIKVDDIVYFEGFGYARCDSKDVFVYTHE